MVSWMGGIYHRPSGVSNGKGGSETSRRFGMKIVIQMEDWYEKRKTIFKEVADCHTIQGWQ